jgi:opacity protein-like surface antigen
MKRVVLMFVLAFGCVIGTAGAQTASAGSNDRSHYLEVTVGPTVGHTASVSFGGEFGWFLTNSIGIFVEGGRMLDAGSADFQNKATLIADYIGGSADAKRPITYGDAGIVYRLRKASPRFHPYALVGVGAARVTNDVTFSVGGTDVTGSLLDEYGVQLGSDLAGSYTKVFVTAGAGTHITLTGRWLVDISYRYGYVPRAKDADGQVVVKTINTNRLQFGFGVTF